MTSWAVRGLAMFGASVAALLLRFLVPRPVGLADNGDGIRLLCQLGAGDPIRPLETYVRLRYGPSPPCQHNYASSQLWLDRIAVRTGHLLGLHETLNLLVLGVLGVLAAAVAISLLVLALRLRGWAAAAGTGALLLLVGDSAFFDYAASVFSEFAAFLGLLLLAAGLLWLRRPGRIRYLGAAVTLVGAVVAVNAKAQTVLFLPVLAAVLLAVAMDRRDRPPGPRRTRLLRRWAPLVLITLLTGLTTQAVQGKDDYGSGFREINAYHAIFHNIVDGQHDTASDLAALGLPPTFARYANTTWWTPLRAVDDPAYPRYQPLISRRNVARYYLGHPVRTAQVLQRAATELLTARPDYLANFAENSGFPPRTKEYRVPVLSRATAAAAPLGLAVLLPWWLLLAIVGIRTWRPSTNHSGVGLVITFLLVSAAGQYLAAGLGEGWEGVKHQTIALFCTLLATTLAATTTLPTGRSADRSADVERHTLQRPSVRGKGC